MQTVSIIQIYHKPESYLDKEIVVRGWVRTVRESKLLSFIALNDGSFFKELQIVAEKDCLDDYDVISKLNVSAYNSSFKAAYKHSYGGVQNPLKGCPGDTSLF